MRKKYFYFLLVFMSFLLVAGCNNKNDNKETVDSKSEVDIVKALINNDEYTIDLEDNETAKAFVELLPLKIDMKELNGNEKYYYLNKSLPSDSSNIKKITAGDVMLYGDDCLVIFYKSFNTSYSYTKIGHINNLKDLGNNNVSLEIYK